MKTPSVIASGESRADPIPGGARREERLESPSIPLDNILDSLDEGVAILNRRGVILRVNPSFSRLFIGKSVGQPAASVVQNSTFREMLDAVLNEHHSSPTFRINMNGETVLNARITPLKDVPLFISDDTPHAVAVFHDISDLVRMSRRRREFMGEVAHELRTPLTTIVGFAETILDLPPHHTEDRQKFTGIILRNARRMSLLVEDMLRLSRLESGNVPLQLACVRAAFVIEDALDSCTSLLEQKHIALNILVDHTMNIEADARYVTQVFCNLLENAARYAPEGSAITIRGERSSLESMAVFTVADEGPGIPEEDCKRVFERFYRVEKERVSPHSTGLGLAICKQIVERHGGTIHAKKGPGGTFIFTVPLAR